MSGARFVLPSQQAADATGTPYAGGSLFFYATGTSNPAATFSDAAQAVPNPNPVVLDPAGRAGSIFLAPSQLYRVVLQDANGAVIFDMDPVGAGAGGPSLTTTGVPVGGIMAFAGYTAPAGWLLCDGSAVSRATYAALFAVIGAIYGQGDGATTFNLPDLRGRVPYGQDTMGGIAANRVTQPVSGIAGATIGASGGDQNSQAHNHTLQFTDPGHVHAATDSGHAHAPPQVGPGAAYMIQVSSGGGFTAQSGALGTEGGATAQASANITVANATTGISGVSTGYGNGASQNMPPTLIMNYVIFAG